jgi:cytochrome c-type biogenesis protein CcmF
MAIALLQCLLPLHGFWKKNVYTLALARPLAFLQGFVISNAFLLLISAFITNNFTLRYVAENSHPSLPFFYRLTAVWGAHEGSFLLWIFMLNFWTMAIGLKSKLWKQEMQALTLSLLGLMSFCFLVFLNFTSNPFQVALQAIPRDLNPLLQDPGFFIHPPMLYAGYVGFSATFAITMSWLITSSSASMKAAQFWASAVRPWVLAAWAFLTVGITLGSWWAYHVLGWGGFWFWDPVENASLLPWMAGAALLHLVIVVEKQGRFLDWGIILAILTFSLSVLGTFLVRSGVLISVHSFAHDPSRGLFLLLLLAFITGLALIIYLYNRPHPLSSTEPPQWLSREGILLIQSIFLFVAMATVLLGTLYPLIMEATGLGSLSIGPPYFNKVLLPLLITAMLIMGFAPISLWNHTPWKSAYVKRNGLLSIILSITLTLFFTRSWDSMVILHLSLIFWVILSVSNLLLQNPSMFFAHLGFALVIMAIVLSTAFSREREVRMQEGEDVTLGPYAFHFTNVRGIQGPNFKSVRGDFVISYHQHMITHLHPEKRIYTVRDMVMTKADIYPAIFHDVYVSLGEPITENSWSVRLYYKPFIRWIWLGGFCMALGAFLSLFGYKGRTHE